MQLLRPRLTRIAVVLIILFLFIYFTISSRQRAKHQVEDGRFRGGGRSRVRREAVKAAFAHGWEGYATHAFPNDDLHPLSNTFQNTRYK